MGDAATAIPSDMVAVLDKFRNEWWLYYVSTEGQIKIIKGPQFGQNEDSKKNPPYEKSDLSITATDIPPAKKGNSQLGVCEYIDSSGKPQTRVYYLNDDNELCELGWSGEEGWFKGALTTQEFEAAPNSVITAVVEKEQLKVYYRGKEKGGMSRLWVAWVTLGEASWTRRPIMSF
ncbi:hypothetical protein K431DRAFT_282489 [Polychaeton citri CBS 116435]|uniref:Fucose-specific lectin n=1 Tax=Polychaeton citri CBS 116435 TaxID=1314669 RepID=A0A9P4USL6_9PEZI|nr:hypothetical protein K431DRAFT_282489 [Polychaeton citri CBS 116435]